VDEFEGKERAKYQHKLAVGIPIDKSYLCVVAD
jgi:hypothetical protein